MQLTPAIKNKKLRPTHKTQSKSKTPVNTTPPPPIEIGYKAIHPSGGTLHQILP